MNDLNMDRFYSQFSRLRPSRKGTIKHDGEKLKPNQKCPCESGKKYKKCCQQRLENMARARGSNVITKEQITNSK